MLLETESEPFLEKDISQPQTSKSKTTYLPKSPTLSALLTFTLTSLLWLGLLLTLYLLHRNIKIPQQPTTKSPLPFFHHAKYTSCGRSVDEALAKNCKYDILLNHWIPSPCVDETSISIYQADGSWIGYADEARTQQLKMEEMGSREFYYTSERDHIIHCAALWKKQFRAFVDGRTRWDSLIANGAHTDHCADYLVNMTEFGKELRSVPIKVFVGFGGCYLKD